MTFEYDWERLAGIYPADFIEKMKGLDGKACWEGYKLVGTKKKGGKTVDDCVKIKKSDHTENPLDEMAIANAFKKQPGTGSSMRMPRLEGVQKAPIDDFHEESPIESLEPNAAMAINQLRVMREKVDILLGMLQPDDNLEPWMATKLTMSVQNLASVADYVRFGVET
jgi:hypothetical protein